MRRAIAPLFMLVLLPSLLWAAALTFPALTGRVVDDAHLLSAATRQQLDARLAQHESATGEQVVVVTLPSLQGQEIEDYGYQLGRAWGIGQKGKNNGALLIVAPKEHKVRIEAGYGMEGRLTDAASSRIINGAILPRFKQGDYEGGIVAGTLGILSALGDAQAGEPVPASAGTAAAGSGDSSFSWGGLLIPLLILFLFLRSSRTGGGGMMRPLLLGGLFGSGGSGRGSDRDGFSGGGGSFGGGGASGSW